TKLAKGRGPRPLCPLLSAYSACSAGFGYGLTHGPPNAAFTTRWTDTTVHTPEGFVQELIPSAILTSICTSATLVEPSLFISQAEGGGGVPLLTAGAAIG